jgi:glycosyltransferase involved in cell wall biosynthesis
MESSRKILILTHNYPRWEGDYAGVFLKELVTHFRSDQVFVYLLAPHFEGAPVFEKGDYFEIHRFRYAPVKSETLAYAGNMHRQVMTLTGFVKFIFFMLAYLIKSFELVNRVKPDLIFAQWLVPSGMVGWLVALFTGKRLFVTSHGTDIALLRKSATLRGMTRLIYRRARRAFVVSNYLRETVLDLDLTQPAKLEVCPMPARTDLFGKQKVTERIPPLILSVARFTKQKQLDVLFRALKILSDNRIEFTCEVYGEGECEVELRSLIAELVLQDKVTLKAPVPQATLAVIYPAARVTVLPSINEGFGMTLVEAQLSGSAVIGANSGGITDIIRHQQTGLLFEPGNAAQLATELKALLTDNQLHHQLVAAAKEQADRLFSPTAIALKYEAALGISKIPPRL